MIHYYIVFLPNTRMVARRYPKMFFRRSPRVYDRFSAKTNYCRINTTAITSGTQRLGYRRLVPSGEFVAYR